MSGPRTSVPKAIVCGLALAFSAAVITACGGNSPLGGGTVYEYGTPEYIQERIRMYEESGIYNFDKVVTEKNLPWDPNGPTIKVSEISERLQASGGQLCNSYGCFEPDGTASRAQDDLSIICGYEAWKDPGWSEMDKLHTVDRLLIRRASFAEFPFDARGGVDCENGKTLVGTGSMITGQPGEGGSTPRSSLTPLTPRTAGD